MNQYQNPNQNPYQYQYQQPIKWGLIIVWFIFFFPLGFYYLMREYRNKRTLNEYGKIMKRTGIICVCIGILYFIFSPQIFTTSDGVALTTSQSYENGLLLLSIFGILGLIFIISGSRKMKIATNQAAMQTSFIQNNEFENNHPFIEASCPNCGAHINARKGIATQCEYCGSQYTIN